MKQMEHYETMHLYFNTVLRLRQDLRNRIQHILQKNGHNNITVEMMQVLYYLANFPPSKQSNQTQIGEYVGSHKSSVTSLVKNLEQRKLVTREMDKHNRRENVISITDYGLSVLKDLNNEVYNTYNLKKIPLTIDDIKNITQLLNAIVES